jgi:hypothetical protein
MGRKPFDYSRYSQQKLAAARLMADPDDKSTNKQIAETSGITERQLYRWKEDPEFVELVNHLAKQHMDAFMSTVYRQLQKKVNEGSVKAIELAMKRMGDLIDRKEITAEVSVEQTTLEGATVEDLDKRIAAQEAKLLDTVEVAPDTFEVVSDGLDDVE